MWGGSCFGQGIPCDAKGLPTKYLGVGPPAARQPGGPGRCGAARRPRLGAEWQIEAEAVERYEMLAQQMETHNNVELARVFKDLARAEGISLGAAVSALARRGLTPPASPVDVTYSPFPVLLSGVPGHVVTDEMVAAHRDE